MSAEFKRPPSLPERPSNDTASYPASLMTIILTTSPVPSNPSTALIETVVRSFAHVPDLFQCQLLIMCDGYSIGHTAKYKRGIVTAEGARNYEEYVSRLRRLASEGLLGRPHSRVGEGECDSGRCGGDGNKCRDNATGHQRITSFPPSLVRVEALPHRRGFGLAVKAALDIIDRGSGSSGTCSPRDSGHEQERHEMGDSEAGTEEMLSVCRSTPFVMVVQHDNAFVRGFNLRAVLRVMAAEEKAALARQAHNMHEVVSAQQQLQRVGAEPNARHVHGNDRCEGAAAGAGLPHASLGVEGDTDASIATISIGRATYGAVPARPVTASHAIRYVGLLSCATLRYAEKVRSRFQIEIAPRVVDTEEDPCGARSHDSGACAQEPLHFMPLLFWFDKTHICSVDHYRRAVFDARYDLDAGEATPLGMRRQGVNLARGKGYKGLCVKRGDFIEDTLGKRELEEIQRCGLGAHGAYGTWLLLGDAATAAASGRGEDDVVVIRHLNGRKFDHNGRRAAGHKLANAAAKGGPKPHCSS
eukprot:g357.t1